MYLFFYINCIYFKAQVGLIVCQSINLYNFKDLEVFLELETYIYICVYTHIIEMKNKTVD